MKKTYTYANVSNKARQIDTTYYIKIQVYACWQ